jgi:hypothetical protein
MKTLLPAWAYALCLAFAVMLGLPGAAHAGNHKGQNCYSHRALTICAHNDAWSKSALKRTYAAKYKKKRWAKRHRRHHAHHHRNYAHHAKAHHRKRHARKHRMRHAAHIDLVTRQHSLAVGSCSTSLPKLPGSAHCVHGAIVHPPVVERLTAPAPHAERGTTRRYFKRGYFDPNAWRYRPTDRQLIRAVHKKKGMKH